MKYQLSSKVLALLLSCSIFFKQHMKITEKRFIVINPHPIPTPTHTGALIQQLLWLLATMGVGRLYKRRKSRKC